MPTYRSHGREYVQPPRHDELPSGVSMPVDADHGRRSNGKVGLGNAMAVLGGKSRKGRTRLTHDVQSLPVDDRLKRQARFMRKRTCSELARNVGAGECGIIASALVKLAAEDMAMREQAMTEGNRDEARKMGESARMHLMYARETCAKDAIARREATPVDHHAFFNAALEAAEKEKAGG